MAKRGDLKKSYARALYNFGDGGTAAAQTIADSTSIPIGSIVTGVTMHAIQAMASSGSATFSVTVGGVAVTGAVPKTALTAGLVTANGGGSVNVGGKTTNADAIGLTIGTAAVNDPGNTNPMLEIIVEYTTTN